MYGKRKSTTKARTYFVKRGKVSAAAGNARRVVRRTADGLVRFVPSNLPTVYPGGDAVVRRFRRLGLDCVIYGAGGGGFNFYNQQTGLPTPWIASSGAIADAPVAPNVYEFGAACQFALTNVLQFNEFTQLFNEYRIDKIELAFTMRNAPTFGQGNGGTPAALPQVYICSDSNDSTVPPSDISVMARGDVQLHSLQKPFVFTIYPKTAVMQYAGIASTGYAAPTRPMWLDVTSPSDSIAHYGVKMWWRNFTDVNSVGLSVHIQPTFYITCKATR